MRNFLHFIQYHNAIPITLGIIFLGAGATFAATNPEAIYSQTQEVVAIDNTYIVGKDLSTYTPRVLITGVTEDTDNYYVAYNFSTIDIIDSVWQDTVKDETMTVSKPDLGPYRDLGVYVTQQLKQSVDREVARLRVTQEIEKRSLSQKVVATTYGGLVGKLLDATTETLPGYEPVVKPPETQGQVAAAAGSAPSTSSGQAGSESSGGGSGKIGLQLLGNNPARLSLGVSYIDLGAVLIDPFNTNVGVHVFQNGAEVISPSVDTSTSSAQSIEYRASDPDGATILVRRIVLIGDAADPGGEISAAGNVNPPAPPASPEATQGTAAPEPEPETPAATSTPPEPAPAPETSEPSSESTDSPVPEPEPTPESEPAPDSTASTTLSASSSPQAEPTPAPEPEPSPATSTLPVTTTSATIASSTPPTDDSTTATTTP